MILSSVSKHVKDQNWFAVWLDFFIVVVGVFIGIQVSNWNAARYGRAAAGKLDIIENDAIKEALSEIVAMVEWRGTFHDRVARTTEHYRYIIEEQVVYDLERTFEDPFRGQFVGVDFDIQSLGQDPKVLSAISAISNATQERRRAYVSILELYQSFLPILEEELRARWSLELKTELGEIK